MRVNPRAVHELSIASAILEQVQTASERNGGVHVSKVGVRIGEVSGVDADALSFGFEALVKDSTLEPLVLEVELCRRVQRCGECAREFGAANSVTTCPDCGSGNTVCVAGEEMDIAFMEVEDA